MSRFAAAQRAAFADICAEVGPGAPTLIGDWVTQDLVAHCYVREHRPDAAPGVLPLGPWSSYTERVMASALRVHGFTALVEEIRTPPLLWRPVDEALNTVEYFVHTEDVRRANGRDPRRTDDEFEQWVWKRLSRQARMSFRRVPAYVRLVPDGGGKPAFVGKGGPAIGVHGPPSELLLLAFNRKDAAKVEVTGDKQLLWSAKLGL